MGGDALRASAEAFVAKVDAVTAAFNAILLVAAFHGVTYTGPSWKDELAALRAALAQARLPTRETTG